MFPVSHFQTTLTEVLLLRYGFLIWGKKKSLWPFDGIFVAFLGTNFDLFFICGAKEIPM